MKNLDELRSETASHRPDLAFCYAHPRTETCLDDMKGGGSNELYRHLIRNSKDGPSPTKRSVVNRWPTHPAFIEIRVHVEQALELYDPLVQLKVILLFSAHSLPMSVANQGDNCPTEVAVTVHAKDGTWYLLRSQVVPSAWLGPQTSDALKGYVKKGVNEMLLIPITFASAHIYTK
ncbi:hypothetical protein KEM48_007149 [Puccinia striiformis f. sp. tritici PST-130]|nr:hypothetical protein H4Q26_007324 [Puccinia striiformis f. sp. tritici PST-130]KAI9622534.1 hypothetical protein KEM48_007149 [Puccinia striiformis f. sp. tritici PST-130]